MTDQEQQLEDGKGTESLGQIDGGNDLPPAYVQTHSDAHRDGMQAASSQHVPYARPSTGTEYPAGSQRAVAPLRVAQSHKALRQAFIVQLGENKSSPDVYLKTTHASMQVQLYLEGALPRKAGIELSNAHGSIKFAIPSRSAGQAVCISAATVHSQIYAALPEDFNGYLKVQISHGSAILDPSIQHRCVVVPNPPDSSSKLTTYRVHGSSVNVSTSIPHKETESEDSLDECALNTIHSNITVTVWSGRMPSSSCLIS